ncbi:MAG: ABC transporter ATP-binding protein [Brevinematales bacterium]|nr:ABC transporter ATP-binding protein [Brevinematales bacterium]
MNNSIILEVVNISKYFGGIRALSNVSFAVEEGKIVSIIGPNGAGKTTVFNIISGFYKPDTGRIIFQNRDITNIRVYDCSRIGISRTFQNIRLFYNMTVLENVMVGRHVRSKSGLASFFDAVLRTKDFHVTEREIQEKSIEYIKMLGLESYMNTLAKNLPYGLQRRLEIARALATEPKLLLLDEPTAGMTYKEVNEIMEIISRIRELGVTILLIEHQMMLVMGISDKIVVLDHGEKIAEGKPEEIKNNRKVIDAYLGIEEEKEYV